MRRIYLFAVVGAGLSGCGDKCTTPWFRDFDGDGFGDPDRLQRSCDAPAGYVHDAQDCDDEEASTRPGAPDACNGIDDDCDGEIDPAGTVWYPDSDGDTWGATETELVACEQPPGFVARPGDCNDSSREVFPGARELCDDLDNDCDLDVDEGAIDGRPLYRDNDGDGFGQFGYELICKLPPYALYSTISGDCNDNDYRINPVAQERCNNGRDDDCDYASDNDDYGGASDKIVLYYDGDHDGYGGPDLAIRCYEPANDDWVGTPGDCDDGDPAVSPVALEWCGGSDEDCDGLTDDEDPGVQGGITRFFDSDGDGYGGPTSAARCDLSEADWVGVDDDCDDADRTIGPDRWWSEDGDGDGAGAGAVLFGLGCTPPLPGLPNLSEADCDDDSALIREGLPDTCGDGVDADCTGFDRPCSGPWSGVNDTAAVALAQALGHPASVATGDLDGDGVSDLAVVTATGAAVTFGPAPERFAVVTADASYDGALASSTFVVTTGVDRQELLVVDEGAGQVVRVSFDARTAGELDRFSVGPGARFGPSGLAPGGSGEVGLLVSTVNDVSLVTYGAVFQQVTWSWAGAGPVVGGGDPDQDGIVDFAAGEVISDTVLVWSSTSTGGVLRAEAHTGLAGPPGAGFGTSLAWVDWDDDGVTDLAVGAPLDDVGGTDAGAVYVFLAPRGLVTSADADLVVTGATPGDRFGTSLVVADVDGDSLPELVVGAPEATVGNPGSGAVSAVVHGQLGITDALDAAALWYGTVQSNFGQEVWATEFDDVGGTDLFMADEDGWWWVPGP